jgi:hypothetical protein
MLIRGRFAADRMSLTLTSPLHQGGWHRIFAISMTPSIRPRLLRAGRESHQKDPEGDEQERGTSQSHGNPASLNLPLRE